MDSEKKYLILLLLFSFIIRAVYSNTAWGWNEEGYIILIREFVKNTSYFFTQESTKIMLVSPLFYIVESPFFLFYNNFVSMHIFSAFMGTVAVFLCFKLGKLFFNAKTGLIFAFIISVFPVHWMISRHVTPENISIPLIMLSITLFLKHKKPFFTGFLLGLAVLFRYESALLFPLFLVYSIKPRKKAALLILGFLIPLLFLAFFSLVFHGMFIPSELYLRIVRNSLTENISYDYEYSLLQVLILLFFYTACFSLPLIPVFFGRISLKKIIFMALAVLCFYILIKVSGLIVRPSLSDFGFPEIVSNVIYSLLASAGFFVFYRIVDSLFKRKNVLLCSWFLAFNFLWFIFMRTYTIQPRYLILASFPVLLMGASGVKKLPVFLLLAFILYFIPGLFLNQWASSSWNTMYSVASYLKDNSDPSDQIIFYPTGGVYEKVYFDPAPFIAVRPQYYSEWDSYRTSIKYAVFDTANFYLINPEIRDFLTQKPELLEKTFNVNVFGLNADTIFVYKTQNITLPSASAKDFVSDYFV